MASRGVICAALELTADDRIAGRAVLFVVVAIAGLSCLVFKMIHVVVDAASHRTSGALLVEELHQ